MELKVMGTGDLFSKQNSPSYLMDNKILIDMPNGNLKKMYNMNIDTNIINHVLITHFHGDHFFDIPFFLSKVSRKVNHLNLYIYSSRNGISIIKKLLKLAYPNSFKKIYKNSKVKYISKLKFNIDDYIITKLPVAHGLKKSYGYIIKKDNVTIGFTGDSGICDNVFYMASTCDYLVADCTYVKGNSKHMGVDDLINLANKYANCKIYGTHLSDAAKKELEKINNIYLLEETINFL